MAGSFSIEWLRNFIHQEVQRLLDRRTRPMPCFVTAYNPAQHTVKVALQPSGTETGWIQVKQLATGAGFGIQAAPNIGDPGWVTFHEDDPRAAVFEGAVSNDLFPPVEIQAGEAIVKTKWGSQLYFRQDGSVAVNDKDGAIVNLNAGTITSTDKAGSVTELDGAGNITMTPQGGKVVINGTAVVTQNVQLGGNILAQDGSRYAGDLHTLGTVTGDTDVVAAGHSGKGHTHLAPGGETGPPVG
jgi:uncharacterized protein involved in type VI secretion and phage assembly